MTKKRFIIIQNGDLFTVRDTIENKPMGVFEFKEDEFSVYFCFHKIIDLLNDLYKEKENWKHKVGQLLFILSQFDEEKVQQLMEDLK